MLQHQGFAFTNLVLTVQIRDKAGNVSEPVSFPLQLQANARQQSPPPGGVFQEKNLGPVAIRIEPPATKG